MATFNDVLQYLLPNGGYYASDITFESIQFLECEPITKAQFEAGFAQYDAWKASQDQAAQAAKEAAEAKLAALGLTTADLRALGL